MKTTLFLSYLLTIAFFCYSSMLLSMSGDELPGIVQQGRIGLPQIQPEQGIAYPPINPLQGITQPALRPDIVAVQHSEERARKRLLVEKELEERARKQRREEKQPDEENAAETSCQQPERQSAFRRVIPRAHQRLSEQIEIQPAFESLPAELQQHVLSFTGPGIRTSRLLSRSIRAQADRMVSTMTIPLHEFNAQNLRGSYEHVKRLKLIRAPYRKNTVTETTILLIPEFFPNLTHLDIAGTQPTARAFTLLCGLQAFGKLTHLDISNNNNYIDDYIVGQLSRAVFAPTLQSLNLSNSHITGAQVRLLADLQAFPNLRELNISYNALTGTGFNALLDTAFAPQLEVLNLQAISFSADEDVIPDFARFMQTFKRLRELTLSHNRLGNERVRMLTQASFAQQLELLNLNSTNSTAAAFEANRDRDVFPRLRQLSIGHNNLSDEGVLNVLDNIFMQHVEILDITTTGITGRAIQRLSQLENGLTALRVLQLGYNNLGDTGLEHLITAPFAPFLRELAIQDTRITHESVRKIVAAQAFPRLRQLNIANSTLGDQGFIYLTQAAFAPVLEGLNVNRTGITSAAFESLESLNRFSRLVRLSLTANALTFQTIVYLSRADFAPRLTYLNLSSLLMTDAWIQILARPGVFISLEQLDISNNRLLSHNSFVRLTQAPFARNLRALNIAYTSLLRGLDDWEKREFILEAFPRLRRYGYFSISERVA